MTWCPWCHLSVDPECPVCRTPSDRAGPPTARQPEPGTPLASFVCECPTATGWPGDEVVHGPACRQHPLYAGAPIDRLVRVMAAVPFADDRVTAVGLGEIVDARRTA